MAKVGLRRSLKIAACGWLIAASAIAATGRSARALDPLVRVVLSGNTPRRALPEFDRGPVDVRSPMQRMILLLKHRPGADAAIDSFLADRHDPNSPNYHHWLTPEEFGSEFGLSNADLADVVGWLKDQGFTIDEIARGRGWINFSGNVGGVERTFGTAIHRFEIEGQMHQANITDPSMPAGLEALVAGVVSLHDFRKVPMHRIQSVSPEANQGFTHYMAPGDFAKIYNTSPLLAAGTDGTGQSIAIVQRTEIDLNDARLFRSSFGLPAKDPVVILNGPSPGDIGGNDELEADLDVEWSGGVATAATVNLVVSASTATTDGVDLSAQYIVDHNVSPIMSTSFGLCEDGLGLTENVFLNNLWAQAAAEGITSFVSSGDDGAAGCYPTTSGLGVNGEASTPYDVAVGGTQFNDKPTSNYWSLTQDPVTLASALGYIPEMGWDASGGGASDVYSKPSWQNAPGVPNDGARDIPDVSLSAAVSNVPYGVYSVSTLTLVGGTSVSAPAMAGILTLVVQKNGRQGNANFVLYDLGRNQYGTSGPAVFHDATSGNNNHHGVTGFDCGSGYDEVTGLGSVDADALLINWPSAVSTADFRLNVMPAELAMAPGESGNMTLSLATWGGFSSSVTLVISGVPAGFSATLDQTELTPGATVTLTVSGSPTAHKGLFPLTISGVGGGQAHSLTIVLLARDLPGSTVTEHSIPTPASFVQGLTVGPDGALWFAEYGGNAIGRMSTSGLAPEFQVPTIGAEPNEIVSGPDGALWFTEFGGEKIGRITTVGSLTEFPLTSGSTPYGIAAGPDGALWYTDASNNVIGRITTAGQVTLFSVPTSSANLNFITAGPDGALWFTEFGGNNIGRITTSGTVTEFPIPTAASMPQGITRGPNNDLWFVESAGNKVGRLTTGGQFTEYAIPFSGSAPNGIVLGPDGALWFTEELGSQIGRVTTSGLMTEYALASVDTFPYDIVVGPDGALWFSETDTNKIGRLSLTGSGSMQMQSATYSVAKDAGSVSMLVTRTGGLSGTVSVQFATQDGTAFSGRDYTASSGTLTFSSGETSKIITVPVISSTTTNPNRTFSVNLSSVGGGATLGQPAGAIVTIIGGGGNPQPGSLSWSRVDSTVGANALSVTLTVTRTGGTAGAVSVDYATADGTAIAGADFTASRGTLDFADGDASKDIVISILDVTAPGPTKTFSVILSNPTGGAALGSPAQEGVFILNELGSPRLGAPVGGVLPPPATTVPGRG